MSFKIVVYIRDFDTCHGSYGPYESVKEAKKHLLENGWSEKHGVTLCESDSYYRLSAHKHSAWHARDWVAKIVGDNCTSKEMLPMADNIG